MVIEPLDREGSLMQLLWLFFSFRGRITRKTFWLASLTLVACDIALSMGIASALGMSWREYWTGSSRTALLDLVTILFFTWPGLAIDFKRLHDRNGTGLRAVVVQLLIVVLIALEYGGYDKGDTLTIVLFNIHLVITIALFCWIIIEMGFLKGDPGPNQYGASSNTAYDKPSPALAQEKSALPKHRQHNDDHTRAIVNPNIGPQHVPDA